MNLKDSMLGEISLLQDLDEKSKTVKFTETKSSSWEGTREMKAALPRWISSGDLLYNIVRTVTIL